MQEGRRFRWQTFVLMCIVADLTGRGFDDR